MNQRRPLVLERLIILAALEGDARLGWVRHSGAAVDPHGPIHTRRLRTAANRRARRQQRGTRWHLVQWRDRVRADLRRPPVQGATMPAPLSPWRWVGRALAIGVGLAVAGWAVGLLGALVAPWLGMVVGALGVMLGGGAWSLARIGGAGLGAGLIGLVAAIGVSLEGRRAVVARTAAVVEFSSLSAWDPRGEAVALYVGPLQHLRQHQSWARERHGSGKSATTTTTLVTPLFDPAERRVVGFHCASDTAVQRDDGRWALASAAWSGTGPVACSAGTKLALAKCAQANLAVAQGAAERFVEVFASEPQLRKAHQLDKALAVPAGFFVLYALLVVVFRRRGAASVGVVS